MTKFNGLLLLRYMVYFFDQKEINGVFRSSFRMHHGTRSLGYITFLDKDVFEKAREFILETESKTVKGADGTKYILWNFGS